LRNGNAISVLALICADKWRRVWCGNRGTCAGQTPRLPIYRDVGSVPDQCRRGILHTHPSDQEAPGREDVCNYTCQGADCDLAGLAAAKNVTGLCNVTMCDRIRSL
jgi:hypothetical protein